MAINNDYISPHITLANDKANRVTLRLVACFRTEYCRVYIVGLLGGVSGGVPGQLNCRVITW